jgi:hypothetical protein
MPLPHQEERVRQSAIRLLTLAICAVALVAIPTLTPAKVRASGIERIKKHKTVHRRQNVRNNGFGNPHQAERAWPGARPPALSGEVCPGNARSFDCKIWPPPFADDPDRKASGTDGG